jgi:hypothetical protein
MDVDTANIKGIQWLNNIANVRVHDTTKEQPVARLIEERKVLQPLPYSPIKEISIKQAGTVIVPLNLDDQPLHHDLSIYNDYCQVAS